MRPRRIYSGDGSNSKVTQFRMVEEIITKIIPHEPFSITRALSGKLSNFFRVKKGRIRVCYVGSRNIERSLSFIFPRPHGSKVI